MNNNNIKDRIEEFVNRVVSRFKPEKVILFGSHASGESEANSDVDILIIMDFDGRPHQKAFEIRKSIQRTFPLDLLVRRADYITHRLNQEDFFLNEIINNGKVLYERTDKRVDQES